jgi:hypothetical protein
MTGMEEAPPSREPSVAPPEASPYPQGGSAAGSPDRRRPSRLELIAGGLLVATVVLHVVAMFPSYMAFAGRNPVSIASQSDQAALFAVVAAAWAAALAFGLAGPAWVRVAAGMAIGAAVGELGYRVADLGQVFRYGTSIAGPGLWVLTAAWIVGAAAAGVAFAAARREHVRSEASYPARSGFHRVAVVAGVGVLSVAAAGFFLPSWDHYTGASTVTGRVVSFNLGNAFAEPWQVVVGNVLSALAIAVVPIGAAILMWNDRRAAVAATSGVLAMLAAQLVAAVVQVDQSVPPSIAGLSGPQATQLGLRLSLKLTGWFALDAIAALALLTAVVVCATARTHDVRPAREASPQGTGEGDGNPQASPAW